MIPFFAILRRIARRADMVLTVGLGVLLATALLASAPTLVHTVVVLGLQQTLLSGNPLVGNLRLTADVNPDAASVAEVDARVRQSLEEHIAPYVQQVIPSVQSPAMFPWIEEELLTEHKVAVRIYDNLEANTILLSGAWPEEPIRAVNRFAVVIGEEMATAYNLQVGDVLPLSQKRQDTVPAIELEIAGIVRDGGAGPDASAPYWFGQYGPLQAYTSGRWAAEYNVFVPDPSFYSVTLALEPRGKVLAAWHVLLDQEQILSAKADEMSSFLVALRDDLRSGGSQVTLDTEMLALLERFEMQTTVVRAPITLLTAEIVLLALYYVTMTAALAIRQCSSEFAVLGSRGSSPKQVFALQAVEAAVLVGVALVSGPILGQGLVRWLIVAGPLADISSGAGAMTGSALGSAWWAAGVAAMASAMGLLLPVPGALRRSIVAQQQGQVRETRAPWWQRLYLDVFAMALGLILLWRLQIHGSIVGGTTARPAVDWLLLFSPLALLLGAATILLRIFPLVLKGLAALTGAGRGLVGPLACWPAARQPAHAARLVLLLTLAMALGMLATGLNATLDRSETERAAYATGGAVRVTTRGPQVAATLATAPGVNAVTRLWRETGSARLRGAYPRFEILALAPEELSNFVTFRDDFADIPLPSLLGRLLPAATTPEMAFFQEAPLHLPGEPGSIGAWLWAPRDEMEGVQHTGRIAVAGRSHHERIEVSAKLRTADGTYLTVTLTPQRSDGCWSSCWGLLPCAPASPWAGISDYRCAWAYFSAAIPELPSTSYPLGLVSLGFRNRATYAGVSRSPSPIRFMFMRLAIDEIGIIDRRSGELTLIEDFERPASIWAQEGGGGSYSSSGGRTAPACQQLSLQFTEQVNTIYLTPYNSRLQTPIPALVSPAFLAATQLEEGMTFRGWAASMPEQTFVVVGEVRYFPTMFENQPIGTSTPNAGFILVSRDTLLERLNIAARADINANELWLTLEENTAIPASLTMQGVRQVVVQEQVRQTLKAHPMALGLRSVTFFGYVLTSLLSLVGFGTYFVMTARQRATVYGVLRSMGLSSAQLYLSLVLEQMVLVLWGLGLGTGLGILLNRLVLRGLPLSLDNQLPIPPFIAQDDWLAVGRLYLLLAAAFLVTLGIATLFLWRTNLHRALRIGQE
jgi:ABC-type lipoprotein release transport system permease subunit